MNRRWQYIGRLGMLAALALCVALAPRCSSPGHIEPLRISTQPWPGSELLYLAKSLGYLEDVPVRLIDFQSNAEQLRAYRNGATDAAALTLDEALVLEVQGGAPRIVLIFDASHGADVIVAREGIECMADLKGKRVGVNSGGLGAFVATRALEISGLDPADLEFVTLEVAEHVRALQAGHVDAVVTFEPARTALLELGARQIFDSSQMPNEILDVLFVREDALDTHDETVRSVIAAWARAVEYLHENPGDAAARMAARLEMTPEAFLASLEGLKIPTLEENRELLQGKDSTLPAAVAKLNDTMAKTGLLPRRANLEGLIHGGLLPEPEDK